MYLIYRNSMQYGHNNSNRNANSSTVVNNSTLQIINSAVTRIDLLYQD